jgi:hypothetical protein
LKALEELKRKLRTVDTPDGFDGCQIEWAIKEGKSESELYAAISQYLAAQAEGFHFVEAEYRACSHLFAEELRLPIESSLGRAENLAEQTGPPSAPSENPMSAEGLAIIDAGIQSRNDFIQTVQSQLDQAIDHYSEKLQ